MKYEKAIADPIRVSKADVICSSKSGDRHSSDKNSPDFSPDFSPDKVKRGRG